MKVGTKSLLFGGHQFLLHPIFVIIAWVKLYKHFPPLKVVFGILIHDWGYWGLDKMDDEEGERHPEWADQFITKIWPNWWERKVFIAKGKYSKSWEGQYWVEKRPVVWEYDLGLLVKYHSRFIARRDGVRASPLCLPDKLGVALYPDWLWILLTTLSGEIKEYMGDPKYEINTGKPLDTRSPKMFIRDYKEMVRKWVEGEVPLEPWVLGE